MALIDARCVPSRVDMPVPTKHEIATLLAELDPAWTIDREHLTRSWSFPDFATALAFVNEVGAVAEHEDHHPDVTLTWGRVRVALTTHVVQRITRNDFILAAKLDRL